MTLIFSVAMQKLGDNAATLVTFWGKCLSIWNSIPNQLFTAAFSDMQHCNKFTLLFLLFPEAPREKAPLKQRGKSRCGMLNKLANRAPQEEQQRERKAWGKVCAADQQLSSRGLPGEHREDRP